MQSCQKSKIAEYVESQPWAESTRHNVRHVLTKLFSISSDPKVVESELLNNGFSKYTVKQYFILAGGFDKKFKEYFESRKQLFRNAYKTKAKSLNEETVNKILSNAGNFYNVIYLMARCGLRLSEAINLKIQDLISPNLFKVIGKGDKQRFVPCNTEQLQALPPSPEDRIAGEVQPHQLRAYLRKYDATPHDLRAFFITHIARAKVLDLDELQVVVGHSSLLTTQRYLRQNINEISDKLLRRSNGN